MGSASSFLPLSTRPAPDATRIVYRPWTVDEFTMQLPAAMQIYADAMGYPSQVLAARHGVALGHTRQSGFRSLGAHSGSGNLVGFGYGYSTASGQWWNSEVRRALGPRADFWLRDAFELCELHVLPSWQGHHIGRLVLEKLLVGLPNEHVVLSTPEGPTRARRLYDSMGFQSIADSFYFATDQRPFAVMARPVPYSPPTQ